MVQIEIKQARRENLQQLAVIFDNYRNFSGQPSDIASGSLFLEERMKKKESIVFIALIDTQIVGFVQLYPLFTSVGMKRLWLLNDLYVDEKMRGKGVAKKIIERCKILVKRTNAKGLFLQTQNTNTKAQELYKKMEFYQETDSLYYCWNREVDSYEKNGELQ